MALNFPISPTVGQIYNAGDISWVWNGTTWKSYSETELITFTGAGTSVITGNFPDFIITSNDEFDGTVTSVSGTGTVSGITLSGTVNSSGNLTLSGTLAVLPSNFSSQTTNTVLAAPSSGNGTPVFRALVAADVPVLNQNTTGNAASASSVPFSGITAKPTTLAGYGITDAQALLVSGTNIKTVNGITVLGSGNLPIDVGVTSFNTRVGAVTLVAADVPVLNQNTTGNAASASSVPFSGITAKPTTLAGYGITDAQALLVSGTNIKTVNGITVLGSGNLPIDVGVTSFNTRVGAVTLVAADVPGLDASKITTGIIDAARLPSYVDDVIESVNLAAFPLTGETGKIYIALDTNKTYRWSGSTYVYITSGAVDSVAGKTGVVTLTKGDVGLGSVDNTADANKAVATALTLATARTIGGVSFNGSADINLPGVNTAGNQNTSGNAATATTATNQSGGTVNATTGAFSGLVTANGGTVQVGSSGGIYRQFRHDGTISSDGSTFSTILNAANYNSYSPTLTGGGASGTWGINVTGSAGGNAATATALQTARSINSVSFNGTANINIRAFTGTGNEYNTAGVEVVGNGATNTVFPSVGFHQPGAFAASIQLRGGTDFRLYAQGASSYASLTLSSLIAGSAVTSGGNTGFRNDVYFNNIRNPIWSFGNAGGHGVSYLQGSSGRDGVDNIALHPNGDPSAGGSSFVFTNGGNAYATASFRAPIFYDSNDTSYYVDQNGTSRLGTVNATLLRSYGNVYTDQNYGYGLVGVYDSYRYQGVFSMGGSWALSADGTSTGNLYGIAWSHPNAGGIAGNLASHGMLIIENGVFKGAWGGGSLRTPSDIRGTIFYDYNDTAKYWDANDSVRVGTGNGYIDIGPKNPGTCHIYTDRSSFYFNQILFENDRRVLTDDIWINNKYFASNGEIYGTRFYDTNDSSYYCDPTATSRFQGLTVGVGGAYTYIRLMDDESPNGYKDLHANGNNVGFLSGQGGWIIRTGNSGDTHTGILYTQIFYDSNNTGFYVDPASTSRFQAVDSFSFYEVSDDRLKTKLSLIENALDKVKQLNGFLYQPSAEGLRNKMPNRVKAALSAQEVRVVQPESVNDDGAYLSIEYTTIIPLLVEAIKELSQQVESLRSQIQ